MIQLSVAPSTSYDVLLQPGLLSQAGTEIVSRLGLAEAGGSDGAPMTGHRKICIVTDATVDALYGQPEHALWQSLEQAGFQVCKYVFPGGEDHKNMETIGRILDFLTHNGFSRSDLLLALGGGITGDITGFASAIYLRGIKYIQVPTSLLAIVDSSVGGKTGVNLPAGKNLAGAFWQPSLVLFDKEVLQTLSRDLLLDGMAEIIKAGMIADETILADVAALKSDAAAESGAADNLEIPPALIAKAIQVKRTLVEQDERDDGARQLLNFGHTFAHAIEKLSDYTITHGHAVAMGMNLVTTATEKLGWTQPGCNQALKTLLQNFGFPLDCPYTATQLAEAASQDKKRRGAEITLVVAEKPGHCVLRKVDVSKLPDLIEGKFA